MNFGGAGRNQVRKHIMIPYFIYGNTHMFIGFDSNNNNELINPLVKNGIDSEKIEWIGDFKSKDNVSDTTLIASTMRVFVEDEDLKGVRYVDYKYYVHSANRNGNFPIETMAALGAFNVYLAKIFTTGKFIV